jgi:hypothetical protein
MSRSKGMNSIIIGTIGGYLQSECHLRLLVTRHIRQWLKRATDSLPWSSNQRVGACSWVMSSYLSNHASEGLHSYDISFCSVRYKSIPCHGGGLWGGPAGQLRVLLILYWYNRKCGAIKSTYVVRPTIARAYEHWLLSMCTLINPLMHWYGTQTVLLNCFPGA